MRVGLMPMSMAARAIGGDRAHRATVPARLQPPPQEAHENDGEQEGDELAFHGEDIAEGDGILKEGGIGGAHVAGEHQQDRVGEDDAHREGQDEGVQLR